jgi:restriction system protein
MAKKKSSPIEDLFEIVTMLPWWIGVASAIGLYFGLHLYATSAGPVTPTSGQVSGVVTHTIFRTLAGVFQYILPLICLVGAGVSFWKKSQRKSLVAKVTESSAASSLDGMSWREFEILVGEAFRQRGYQVIDLGGTGPDGGVDLVLSKGTEKILVQCKQWKAFKVGVDIVRELYGVMAAKGAAGGFVVTSGTFTADAIEFCKGRNVTLIAGEMLFEMLKSAKTDLKQSTNPKVRAGPAVGSTKEPANSACPLCGSPMVKREAKRGSNVGNVFWGCSTYPKCRGTAPI